MALKRFGNLLLDPVMVEFVTVYLNGTGGQQEQASAIVNLGSCYGDIPVHPDDAKRLMDYLEGNAVSHGQTPDQTE